MFIDFKRYHRCAFVFVVTLPCYVGCIPVPDFPSELDVLLSADGEPQTVPVGTGPAILAGTTWAGYVGEPLQERPPGESVGPYGGIAGLDLTEPLAVDDLFVRVEFGEGGRVARLYDNRLYTVAIIPELIVDGALHPAALPPLMYAQESYGIAVGDRVGLAAPVRIYAFGQLIGAGVAYAWGRVTGDRIDGTFGYLTTITLPAIAPMTGADQFRFYALREQ